MKRVQRDLRKSKTEREGESPLFFFCLYFWVYLPRAKNKVQRATLIAVVSTVVSDFFCLTSSVVHGRPVGRCDCVKKKTVLDVSICIVYMLAYLPRAEGKEKKQRAEGLLAYLPRALGIVIGICV